MYILTEKKLEIISEIEKGKSHTCRLVAKSFSIPKSTVDDIWKNREKITKHVTASAFSSPVFAKKSCTYSPWSQPTQIREVLLYFLS